MESPDIALPPKVRKHTLGGHEIGKMLLELRLERPHSAWVNPVNSRKIKQNMGISPL
jgi:hypothetical protein